MGTLLLHTTKRSISLRVKTLLGRDAACDLQVDHPKVSHEHASLRWRSVGWELRDLGSVNGTYVGERRLGSGERALLEMGASFSLGHSGASFELLDASPPPVAAVHRATGQLHVAKDGILALPREDDPQLTLSATSDGRWFLEIGHDVRLAKNGEEAVVGSDRYILEVPTATTGTVSSGAGTPSIESIHLKFKVAPDEESVEITLLSGNKSFTVPPRHYHYLLLTLARAWIADAGLPISVRGFRERDELCKKLVMDPMKLNVEIYRLRKQFAELGVQGAAGLVERRPGTFEVRIGIPSVAVATD